MNKYKLLIFDMDGTILDTLSDITTAVNYAMGELRLPEHTRDQVREYVGSGAKTLFERALGENTDSETLLTGVNIFKSYYKEHCQDETAPFPGIKEILMEAKKRGYKLAVVSNKPDESVQILVERYFAGLFDFALGEREDIRKKPAPDMVDYCLKHFGLDKKDAIYIGDSDVDYMTSYNSGLNVILVTWGFKSREFLQQFDTDNYADKAEDILEFV